MNKTLKYLLLAAPLFTAQAFAQSHPFEGASIGVNASLDTHSIDVTFSPSKLSGLGQTFQGGNLQAAWSWMLAPSVAFSVGASYSLADVDLGYFSSPVVAISLKKKNAYMVYLEPGIKTSDATLVYAKVGYEGTTLRQESTGNRLDKDIDGVSYGVGVRTFLGDNIYVQAEVKQLYYTAATFPGQNSEFKLTGTSGLIGLGYQF